jgi:hypothetical protein
MCETNFAYLHLIRRGFGGVSRCHSVVNKESSEYQEDGSEEEDGRHDVGDGRVENM